MTGSRIRRRLSPADERGQMLVSVIVLLALMFFIGSAMALSVSSSLHAIAQTTTVDATGYAAEAAVAQGFARTAATPNPAPSVVLDSQDGRAAPSAGCNAGPQPRQQQRHVGGTQTNQPGGAWSYAYEVVANGNLVGRSAIGSAIGPNSLDVDNYLTITIPHISIQGNPTITFEVYRTAAGGSPSTLGCVGVFSEQNGNTLVLDTGPVSPAPPMCTGSSVVQAFGAVNGYGPGTAGGSLTSTTCRVPLAQGPNALKMWAAPGEAVVAGACLAQPLNPAFVPGVKPWTIWGVIGWESTSSPASLEVSTGACADQGTECLTQPAAAGAIYYWCTMLPNSQAGTLYVNVTGGSALVKPFVVLAADSGTDCVATSIGQAGKLVDEGAQLMPGCAWAGSTASLWNRVLP